MNAQVPHQQSNVRPDKLCTTYKWSFEDWSMLSNEYSKGRLSNRFVLTDSNGCQCDLKFYASEEIKDCRMIIGFLHYFRFQILQTIVSVVDKNMKKLVTVKRTFLKDMPRYAIEIDLRNAEYAEGKSLGCSTSKYLQNDTLILFVEIVIVKDIKDSIVTTASNQSFVTDVCDKIHEMFAHTDFSDVTLDVRGEQLYAHRVILSLASDVFSAMFRSGMKEAEEGVVHIDDTDPTVFKEFLRYLYTGQVRRMETVARDLMVLADKYQVCNLRLFCKNYLNGL